MKLGRAQERLAAAVVVLDGFEQLVAWQLARVPECLAELGLEHPHLLVAVASGERFQGVEIIAFRVQVRCRDRDERHERAVRVPLPVER